MGERLAMPVNSDQYEKAVRAQMIHWYHAEEVEEHMHIIVADLGDLPCAAVPRQPSVFQASSLQLKTVRKTSL